MAENSGLDVCDGYLELTVARVETAVEKCGGVMCVTGRSKTAAPSITMKDVRRYGKLE
jgi:hypothetical protein